MQFGFDEPRRKPIKVSVKKVVYKRAKGKCERCGINMTMSQGHFHHTRTPSISPTAKTVQFLCPNCHSLTDTWRGKNINSGKVKVSDEEILTAYKKTANIRQTLIEVGLAPKGGNYSRVKKLLKPE